MRNAQPRALDPLFSVSRFGRQFSLRASVAGSSRLLPFACFSLGGVDSYGVATTLLNDEKKSRVSLLVSVEYLTRCRTLSPDSVNVLEGK